MYLPLCLFVKQETPKEVHDFSLILGKGFRLARARLIGKILHQLHLLDADLLWRFFHDLVDEERHIGRLQG